jgi:hypothetical protein
MKLFLFLINIVFIYINNIVIIVNFIFKIKMLYRLKHIIKLNTFVKNFVDILFNIHKHDIMGVRQRNIYYMTYITQYTYYKSRQKSSIISSIITRIYPCAVKRTKPDVLILVHIIFCISNITMIVGFSTSR